jgi:hypothetical protein
MEKCYKCGADTMLYSSNVPICLECVEKDQAQGRSENGLAHSIQPATKKAKAASATDIARRHCLTH